MCLVSNAASDVFMCACWVITLDMSALFFKLHYMCDQCLMRLYMLQVYLVYDAAANVYMCASCVLLQHMYTCVPECAAAVHVYICAWCVMPLYMCAGCVMSLYI